MKRLAGFGMCFAGGSMMAHDLVLAGIAIIIAGFAHMLNKENNNA